MKNKRSKDRWYHKIWYFFDVHYDSWSLGFNVGISKGNNLYDIWFWINVGPFSFTYSLDVAI